MTAALFDGLGAAITSAFMSREVVTYKPTGAASRTVSAIFSPEHRTVKLDQDGVPVETVSRSVTCSVAEVPSPKNGEQVTVDGVPYVIRSVERSGGLVTLLLGAGSANIQTPGMPIITPR